MWKLTISDGEGWFQSGIFFLIQLKQHFNFGLSWRWICWHPHIRIIAHWKIHYLWEPLDWLPSSILGHSGELLVLCKFLTEHVTGQFRLLILVAPWWIEASWLLTVLIVLLDTLCCPIVKNIFMDVLEDQVFKGLPLLHLILAAQRCLVCRHRFSSSVCQAVAGAHWAMLEGMDQLICSRGCTKQCLFCPIINWFLGSVI